MEKIGIRKKGRGVGRMWQFVKSHMEPFDQSSIPAAWTEAFKLVEMRWLEVKYEVYALRFALFRI